MKAQKCKKPLHRRQNRRSILKIKQQAKKPRFKQDSPGDWVYLPMYQPRELQGLSHVRLTRPRGLRGGTYGAASEPRIFDAAQRREWEERRQREEREAEDALTLDDPELDFEDDLETDLDDDGGPDLDDDQELDIDDDPESGLDGDPEFDLDNDPELGLADDSELDLDDRDQIIDDDLVPDSEIK